MKQGEAGGVVQIERDAQINYRNKIEKLKTRGIFELTFSVDIYARSLISHL